MNNLDKTYTNLLQDILDNGVKKETRNGSTISVFGRQIRHKMSDGFPLLTTKKLHWKSIVGELIWFLRGDTNIKWLVDNQINIWNGDAFKDFKSKQYPHSSGLNEFEMEDFLLAIKNGQYEGYNLGELGPIYGKQWREWSNYRRVDSVDEVWSDYRKQDPIDQIANLINDLKTNPDSRRLMVSAWNVGELDQMTLPPCHYGFQVYTRELSREERIQIYVNQYMGGVGKPAGFEDAKLTTRDIPTRAISLMWNQRSCDFPLGIPFNIASYGLLLEIIGKMVNMVPEELIGNLGDCHIYLNQIEGCKEQIGRELRIDERICMCYENPSLDLTKIHEDMSDDEFKIVCDVFNIPTRTREPFELPSLKIEKTDTFFQSLGCDLSLLTHLDISDFKLEGYQSHPIIKFPLSN